MLQVVPVISDQLPVIIYQLSAISYWFDRVFHFNAVNPYFYWSLNHYLLITVYWSLITFFLPIQLYL